MSLLIENADIEMLARQLAEYNGVDVAEAVATALRHETERLAVAADDTAGLVGDLVAIGNRCAALPDRDQRPCEVILGYDEQGAWVPWS